MQVIIWAAVIGICKRIKKTFIRSVVFNAGRIPGNNVKFLRKEVEKAHIISEGNLSSIKTDIHSKG